MSEKFIVKIDSDFEEIVPTFIDNRHKDIEQITDLLANGDLTGVQVIAHKLAGNAGSYGFTELGKVGAEMEEACINNDRAAIEEQFGKFKSYMENVVVEYE